MAAARSAIRWSGIHSKTAKPNAAIATVSLFTRPTLSRAETGAALLNPNIEMMHILARAVGFKDSIIAVAAPASAGTRDGEIFKYKIR